MLGKPSYIMYANILEGLQCPNVSVLSPWSTRVIGARRDPNCEIPNELDLMLRQESFAHCVQIKPSVLSIFDRAIVQIESVYIYISGHGSDILTYEKTTARWSFTPSRLSN